MQAIVDRGTNVSLNWTMLVVSDNSMTEIIVESTHQSGSEFPIGTTNITVTATDSSGNVASCTFQAVVCRELDIFVYIFCRTL